VRGIARSVQSTEYRKRFSFIDDLRAERDPSRAEELNALLIEALKAGKTERIHMAPPEPVDLEGIDGFTFADREDAEVHQDLEIEEFLKTLGDPRR